MAITGLKLKKQRKLYTEIDNNTTTRTTQRKLLLLHAYQPTMEVLTIGQISFQ